MGRPPNPRGAGWQSGCRDPPTGPNHGQPKGSAGHTNTYTPAARFWSQLSAYPLFYNRAAQARRKLTDLVQPRATLPTVSSNIPLHGPGAHLTPNASSPRETGEVQGREQTSNMQYQARPTRWAARDQLSSPKQSNVTQPTPSPTPRRDLKPQRAAHPRIVSTPTRDDPRDAHSNFPRPTVVSSTWVVLSSLFPASGIVQ